jgi:hypothetical protein
MGVDDYIDFDEWDGYNGDEQPRETKCRLCGCANVYWQKNAQTGKWELRQFSRSISGKLHACKPEDRDAMVGDVFEDLD